MLYGILLHECIHAAQWLDSYQHGPDFVDLCTLAAPLIGCPPPTLEPGPALTDERPESWPIWNMMLSGAMPVQAQVTDPLPRPARGSETAPPEFLSTPSPSAPAIPPKQAASERAADFLKE